MRGFPEQQKMERNFGTKLTGWFFIVTALMLWLGWMLMPARIGTFFQVADFSTIYENLLFWIWMYRIHLFGMIFAVISLSALAALVADTPSRILVWPGTAVASSGMLVSAVATAFYYHFGAWGAIDMNGQSAETVAAFVDSLRLSTEHVTCLVRFGRLFSGLGLLILALAILKWRLFPKWSGIWAALVGLSAMALTMGLPDDLALYVPVFHLTAAWFGVSGIVSLHSGIRLDQ